MGVDIVVDQGIGHVTQVVAEGAFYAPTTEGTYQFTLANGLANVLDSSPPPSDHWPVSTASVTLGAPLTFTVGDITCILGDVNDDGTIDGLDIQPFIGVFLDAGSAAPKQFCAADMDEDAILDSEDVSSFVAALLDVVISCIPGDVNDDSALDGRDIQYFVGVLLDPPGASPQQFCAADCDENSQITVDDISPFIEDLTVIGE